MLEAPTDLTAPTGDLEDDDGAMTRAGVLKLFGATAAGATGLALIQAGPSVAATPRYSTATDITVLQYALMLEHLGATFYDEALKSAHLTGAAKTIAETFRSHERAHTVAVEKAIRSLGGTPNASPTFDFGSAVKSEKAFLATSEKIETLCVETVDGAGGLVSKPVLATAATLVSVEARQVSYVRYVLGLSPAPYLLFPAVTPAQSMAKLAATHFIVKK
jgi:hypothetical protein